ncbi:hypothetical protein [Kutzneria sp. NPDC052558]|uniref:helix-turn-helix domain-containing protein n=1 Tax=Kutzneria sp. NPDC052558 TaxID=3364121 RepID=UPI0037C9FD47
MSSPQSKVHRMFEPLEPIATTTHSAVANEAFLALGMRNDWDGYFAGRAALLGKAPAEVVHAVSTTSPTVGWRATSHGCRGRSPHR